jgi:hypothetical protein
LSFCFRVYFREPEGGGSSATRQLCATVFPFPSISHLSLGEAGEAQVGLDDAEAGEQLLSLLVADGRSDNDVVARNPVDGRGDAVLVASLERVDDAEHLGGVAASGGRVGEDGADLLVGVDDEDAADGEGDALFVDVGSVLVVDPVRRIQLVGCLFAAKVGSFAPDDGGLLAVAPGVASASCPP